MPEVKDPSLLRQLNGAPTASPVVVPAIRETIPPKPAAPKTTYRTLTPAEASQRGLDPGGIYQQSSEGSVSKVGEASVSVPTPGDTSLTGEDYLKTLSPGLAGEVKALSEGRRAFPTGTALKNQKVQELIAAATQYDPTLDAANSATRVNTRKNFTSGRARQNVTAINTAIGHLGALKDKAEALENRSFPLWNSVANTYETATGDPRVKEFNIARDAVANELMRVFRQVGASTSEIDDWKNTIGSSDSPEQLHKEIETAVDLLNSRLLAMQDEYQQGMGRSADVYEFLTPKSKAILNKLAPGIVPPGADSPGAGGDGDGGGPEPSSPPNPLQQPDSGPPQVQISSSSQMVEPTAEQQAAAAKLGAMIARGMPLANIQLFAKKNGLDYLKSNLAQIDAARRNPNSAVAKWLKQNPGKAYPVNLNPYNRPLSEGEELGAEIAGSPFGAAAVGAAKTLTGNMLDEAIGAFGGDTDEARRKEALLEQEHPLATGAGELAAGLALPFPGANASALARIGTAGGLGGAFGFGSGEGDIIDRLPGTLVGAATGLATGGAIEGAPSAARFLFGKKGVPGGDDAVALARAAEEEGVPVSRPIIDPGSRAKMARIEAQPGGHAPVREGLEATRQALAERAESLRGSGAPQEPGVMGQRIQGAAQRDMDAQRKRAGDLYERASAAAGDATVEGREAVAELDEQIAKLGRNPNTNRALLNYLRSVRSDFVGADGKLLPKTVDEIRQLRTTLSGEINRRNLTKTPAEGIVSRVLDRAKDDIERDLYDAGPKGAEARSLYRQGDILWRLAKRDERQVAQKLLGRADAPMRGDQAMNAALAWVREGAEGRTLARRFWDKLNPDERADFAATLAEKYGRRTPDEDFSPAQFVAATRTIPPSSRALIFGEDGARSIANLRQLSKAFTAAQKSLNNSRSGMVSNWAHFLAGLTKGGVTGSVIGGIAGGVPGGIAGGVALSGAEALIRRLSAKMLMSPDMTRWLATAPLATTEQKVVQHIARLTKIAARNPAIAQDALGLRNALLENIGSKVPAAVADTPSETPSPAPSADADEPGQE